MIILFNVLIIYVISALHVRKMLLRWYVTKVLQHVKITVDIGYFLKLWHDIIFIKISGITIPDRSLNLGLKLIVMFVSCLLKKTHMIRTKVIINDGIHNRSKLSKQNCLPILIKHHQWNNCDIFFIDKFLINFTVFGWNYDLKIDNLIYMSSMFFQSWMFHIANMKFNSFLLFTGFHIYFCRMSQ